ncbi:MAG: hypothetical protein AB7T74_17435 [Clostridia bacterium]
MHESGARTFREQLWNALHGRQMLLILDNSEQLMAAATLMDQLQANYPETKFIVTSGEALRIRAERVFRVSTLNVPKAGIGTALTSLSQYDAITLFLERAMAINADFKATNDNAPAIAEICSRLEGLPLAIELAAARVDLLSPQAIVQRLGNILGLLTRGATDLPFRQRTLRAAIDGSYRLLAEDEQTLFCHLSVFAGGFTAESMERISADGKSKSSAMTILDDEHDNLATAFDHFIGRGNQDSQLRLCGAHRYSRKPRLCINPSGIDGWGMASYEYGMTLFRKGEIDQSTTLFEQVLGYIPEVGKTIIASAHIGLGMIEANIANFDSALQHLSSGAAMRISLKRFLALLKFRCV